MDRQQQAEALANSWKTELRWQGIQRTYSPEDVVRLRSSVQIEYTLARLGAERLWHLMHTEPFVRALGALTGNQAVQQVLGRPAAVRAIHAGLECGVIKDKFEGMDAISLGPTIRGAHSPDERVHIGSVHSFWKILLETLRSIYSH